MTKEVTCSGQRKPGTCFVPEELQVTYSDPEEPRAICFDQEDLPTLQRKLRDTYSVLAELPPTYFDPEKPLVICFGQEEHQAFVVFDIFEPDLAKGLDLHLAVDTEDHL